MSSDVRSAPRGSHSEPPAPPAPDPARVGGPRGWVVSVGVLTVLGLLGVAGALALGNGAGADAGSAAGSAVSPSSAGWTASTVVPGVGGSSAVPSVGSSAAGSSKVPAGASPGTPGRSAAGGRSAADRLAGIATTKVVQSGSGRLVVVPGTAPAPASAAPRMTVRVEVEDGIGADGPALASFVMDTLNDPRSWGHGGTLSFARTDGPADIQVILASPDLSARLCAPAQTYGTASCGGGGKAILTMYRWMHGIPDYGDDVTTYRQYAVNHEVGHVLGHAHAFCDPGHLAPVMVAQSKGLHGCLPNAWPFPTSP